ncbi:polysaccharide deacetylase family protein (plasmid) [Mesorhizobium sp. AR07]|nr:polysaccharide deacetylase family protein [Mesorhizobium sp. AR07]
MPGDALTPTFEDLPNPHCIPQIRHVLAPHRVPATFFVIGAYAADRPELSPPL